MGQKPLLSILINNYNYGRFVGQAIDSALDQTYPHVEVVVVDDGSTDSSREVIAGYGDRVIPVFKENGGQASAFNAGFAASQGQILCLLDADDLYLPEKAARIIQIFEAHPDVGWVFHNLLLLDIDTDQRFARISGRSSGVYDLRADVRRGQLPFTGPATSGLCFSRSLLAQILPMPEAHCVTVGDRYLKQASMGLGKGFFSDERLAVQRIHDGNRFTFHDDRQQSRARIAITTAHWLRIQFPEFARLADNGVAHGLGIYWEMGGVEPEYKPLVTDYMAARPLPRRIVIGLRAIYHWLKPTQSQKQGWELIDRPFPTARGSL